MKNGLIFILIGVIILLGIVFQINIGFYVFLELFFGIVFLIDGLKIFKKFKGTSLGSLIFGSILILDVFELLPTELTFGRIILLLIASYLVGMGISSIFIKGIFSFKKSDFGKDEKLEMEFPYNELNKKYELNTFLDWTKVNINSSNIESAVKIKTTADKEIFKRDFNMDNSIIKISNKLKVSNIKVPERAKLQLYINKNIDYLLIGEYSVSDITLDLRETHLKDAKFKTTASKMVIIPSDSIDSVIDADFEISSIKIRLPHNVGLVLNHRGELNFKSFEGLEEREDGSYVSSNFSTAEHTCYLNISSEMSRIGVEII